MCSLIKLENGGYVADIKQKYIANIAAAAKDSQNINRIVLFGSATQTRCTDASDIDIAVFGSKKSSEYLRSKEFKEFQRKLFSFDDFTQDYDILYFTDNLPYSDPIMRDIVNGTEIYRRA